MPTLLDLVRGAVTVDVDSMDPAIAARHTTPTHAFCDMTSNQAIVHTEAVRPDRAALVAAACDRARQPGSDLEHQVADACDILAVLLAKAVYPYLAGRVLVQTSPSAAHDADRTVAHAERLVQLFEAEGIPRSRVCVKIPATPESVVACHRLERAGIRTLATCLFNLPQALAAAQAGCLYVAPYFNELRVHFEPGLWREYRATFREHPGIRVIGTVLQAFKDMGANTLVMPASIVTVEEALALTALKPDHLTISGAVLDKLAAESNKELIKDAKFDKPLEIDAEALKVDYLANGAEALREALAQDAEATRKLADALKIFGEMEEKTKALLRAKLESS